MGCKQLLSTLIASYCLSNAAWAGTHHPENDLDELNTLMAFLQEETRLATKNRMNADYVPGMVTLLHGDELRAQGATTVAEGLNRVAGFYLSHNNAGEPMAIVRGIGTSNTGSNLKILLDGVPANRPLDASADWLYRMPISLIERIEVIRGPGSAVYGEFAFSGVVNLITRKENRLVTRVGSDKLVHADLALSHIFATGARAALTLSSWDKDRSGLKTNEDNFARRGNGYSLGNVYDQEQGQLLFAEASHYGYNLQLQYADVERGAWYGRLAALPRELDPREESFLSLHMNKDWQLKPDLSVGFIAAYMETEVDHATFLPLPAGAPIPNSDSFSTNESFRRDHDEDSAERIQLHLQWSGIANHTLYMEAGYSHSEIEFSMVDIFPANNAAEGNRPPPPSNQPPPPVPAPAAAGPNDKDRSLLSFTLQDQWTLSDGIELTLGFRHDDYDDWGSNTSPRAALVWRINDRHILKTQYAQAFRPPTLDDLHPAPRTFPQGTRYEPLEEEHLYSSELSYIYNGLNQSLRATLFDTKVKGLIELFVQPGFLPVLRNRGQLQSTGIELEWQQKIGRSWEWHANLSYADTEDMNDRDDTITGSVEWMANVGISWHMTSRIQHSLLANYIGEQENWENSRPSPQSAFDDYSLVDYTLTLQHLFDINGLSLQASVKNLTDREFNTLANPSQYPEGLSHIGRTTWAQLNYQF